MAHIACAKYVDGLPLNRQEKQFHRLGLSLPRATSANWMIKLEGDPKGASVIILGAGLAGMTAAIELRKVGYNVQILEYRDRAGGRSWTLRGGDTYTELGGFTQHCAFDKDLYINPGPWRIPYHHRALLHYCKRLGVKLQPFVELNANALLHNSKAFGGVPQRSRHIMSDFNGYVSELLSKATNQGKLDDAVSKEDREILLEALRSWGALDKDCNYSPATASRMRGYAKEPGGGPDGAPTPSTPISREDILRSGLWSYLNFPLTFEYEQTLFQPIGGMDMIAQAFAREVHQLIRFNTKVTEIAQDEKGVTVTYVDAKAGGVSQHARADWCVCTIPLSVSRWHPSWRCHGRERRRPDGRRRQHCRTIGRHRGTRRNLPFRGRLSPGARQNRGGTDRSR